MKKAIVFYFHGQDSSPALQLEKLKEHFPDTHPLSVEDNPYSIHHLDEAIMDILVNDYLVDEDSEIVFVSDSLGVEEARQMGSLASIWNAPCITSTDLDTVITNIKKRIE